MPNKKSSQTYSLAVPHHPVLTSSMRLTEDESKLLAQELLIYYQKTVLEEVDVLDREFFWGLTIALDSAVKASNHVMVKELSAVILQINERNPQQLILMLAQTIPEGKYAGQSLTYLWMDIFYSAAYDENSFSILTTLSFIFNALLAKSGSAFCSLLVETMKEGTGRGKNALTLLMNTLQHLASLPENQIATADVSWLLLNLIENSPDIIGPALSQEITYGSLNKKSGVYFIANILKMACADNPAVALNLCKVLEETQRANPAQFIRTLCQVNESGDYRGLTNLNILLLSLVSASYIDKNSTVINALIYVIDEANAADSTNSLNLALITPAPIGTYQNVNGFMMIVRSLIAAINHDVDINPIADFLYKLIGKDPEGLGDAFTQMAHNSTIKDYQVSPLMLLINKRLEDGLPDTAQYRLDQIIKKLASSSSAVKMHSSLSKEHSNTFFFNCMLETVQSRESSQEDTDRKLMENGSSPLSPYHFFAGEPENLPEIAPTEIPTSKSGNTGSR